MDIKRTGTFSNIEFHAESGDILGMELRIVRIRSGYVGMLQICEGGPGDIIMVEPKFTGDKLHFLIQHKWYNGSFDGVIENDGVRGQFTFSSNVGEMKFMPRTKSYWD